MSQSEKEDSKRYLKYYNLCLNLINNPNDTIENSDNITYKDLYNNSTGAARNSIDYIKFNLNAKLEYLKDIRKINFFPELAYYCSYDINSGIFLQDKEKYNFVWHLKPPILKEIISVPDFSILKPIPSRLGVIFLLFKYTKKYPDDEDDITYIVKYIDDTSVEFKDSYEDIESYFNQLEDIEYKKKCIYNNLMNKYKNTDIYNNNTDLLNILKNKHPAKRKYDNNSDDNEIINNSKNKDDNQSKKKFKLNKDNSIKKENIEEDDSKSNMIIYQEILLKLTEIII